LVICGRCLIYVDLSELQSLISEGREMITNQSRRQDEMTDRNLRLLDKRLLSSAEKVKESVDSALVVNTQEQDLTLAYFCLLERLAAAEATLMTVLCADNNSSSSSSSNSNNTAGTGSNRNARGMSNGQTRKGWVYQAVNAISPDHLHYESLLANSYSNSSSSSNNSNRVELLGMYRLLPNIGNHSIFMASSSSRQLMAASSRHRIDRVKVYTVVTAEEFRNLLLRSPQAWQSATVGKQPATRLFCSHPGKSRFLYLNCSSMCDTDSSVELISCLCDCYGESFSYDYVQELKQGKGLFEHGADESSMSARLAKMDKLQQALRIKFICVIRYYIPFCRILRVTHLAIIPDIVVIY
jgi:hypothetical protein